MDLEGWEYEGIICNRSYYRKSIFSIEEHNGSYRLSVHSSTPFVEFYKKEFYIKNVEELKEKMCEIGNAYCNFYHRITREFCEMVELFN